MNYMNEKQKSVCSVSGILLPKKILLYFICIILISQFYIPVVFAAGTLNIIIGSVNAKPGETVAVPFTLETNPGIAGLRMKIEYDSSRLKIDTPNDVEKGTALKTLSYVGIDATTVKNNPITVLWYGIRDDSSTGAILNVKFTVLNDAPDGEAYITVTCAPNDVVNAKGDKLSFSVQNGSVTVTGNGVTGVLPTQDNNPAEIPQNKGDTETVPAGDSSINNEVSTLYNNIPNTEKNAPESVPEDTIIPKIVKFNDVSENDWFFNAVSFVASRGLFQGVGDDLFEPESTMTRGMFLTVLARLDGEDLSKYKISPYSDTAIDMWYGPAIAWAEETGLIDAGILSGCTPGTFRPDDSITREQMALIFANYIKMKNLSLKLTATKEFADIGEASEWAKSAIRTMRDSAIINGIGDNLYNPKGIASRAEVAQIFTNLIYAIINGI